MHVGIFKLTAHARAPLGASEVQRLRVLPLQAPGPLQRAGGLRAIPGPLWARGPCAAGAGGGEEGGGRRGGREESPKNNTHKRMRKGFVAFGVGGGEMTHPIYSVQT